jgi:uncharacterized membrane protein YfcA
MNTLEFTAVLAFSAALIGLLGSLTGLGGGFAVVPLLTLAFGVDLRYAIGASLITVIATSSGSAAAYVREGYANIRIGMFLEVATTLGALAGAALALHVSKSAIGVVFGVVLLYSAFLQMRKRDDAPKECAPGWLAKYFRLEGAYPSPAGVSPYRAQRVPGCIAVMAAAGILSGLLGIGSGIVKVLALDRVMGLPFKVSTSTSNFMIGVTAAASAGLYFNRGYIDPGLAMPVMLGVLGGSFLGARWMPRANPVRLRAVFAGVLLAVGCGMIYNGASGRL